MRHLKKGRKFGRTRNKRNALIKSLIAACLARGAIRTTEAKAKEMRSVLERVITRAKNPTLANRRLLRRTLTQAMTQKAVTRAAGIARTSGYTRITKLGARKSDGAAMAMIELLAS